MLKLFEEYYKFSKDYFSIYTDNGYSGKEDFFKFNNILCFGKSKEKNFSIDKFNGNEINLPFNLDEIIDNLRLEKYLTDTSKNSNNNLLKQLYYFLRPFMPDLIRHKLQSFSMRNWSNITFPKFPVDVTVENIFETIILAHLKGNNGTEIPFIWFWPNGKKACLLMTHDVEESEGLAFSEELMDIDDKYGISSTFNMVPEKRYNPNSKQVKHFQERGFEVLLHGLNHDGKLFSSKEIFRKRLEKIHKYAKDLGIEGFRSPVLYRNLDWYNLFELKYDLSVPNNANIDPQKGGCCTVMPYKIFNILELPLTMIQDHPLYYYLNDFTIDLWKQQAEIILSKSGLLSFNIHPDYTIAENAKQNYKRLLVYLSGLKDTLNLWNPLPKEIYDWWTERNKMELIQKDGKWEIKGNESGKGRIAYMKLKNNVLDISVDN